MSELIIANQLESVVIEITDKCNLQCRHCMNRPDCVGIEVNFENVFHAIKKLNEYGVKKIYLSGGEPLLHKDIFKIISLCDIYPNVEFIITTNGLLFTNEILNEFVNRENLLLQISIDGTQKDIYEYTRGKGTYETFKQKMGLWEKSKIKRGLARTCLNKFNYRDLENIYKYCIFHKLFPSFVFVDALGNGKENWEELQLSLAEKIFCISTINRLNNQYEYPVSTPEAPVTCNFTEGSGICSLLIRANGNIAPCQYFYDISIGNIYEDQIRDILSHKFIVSTIETAKKRQKEMFHNSKCQHCKIRAACNFGCIGKANELGDIMSFDGMCEQRITTALCYSNGLISENKYSQRANTVICEKLDNTEIN